MFKGGSLVSIVQWHLCLVCHLHSHNGTQTKLAKYILRICSYCFSHGRKLYLFYELFYGHHNVFALYFPFPPIYPILCDQSELLLRLQCYTSTYLQIASDLWKEIDLEWIALRLNHQNLITST